MNDNKALGFKRKALRKVIEAFDAGKCGVPHSL